jgi:solute carrier family 25 phosphate transporter 23/24/25/41
VLQAIRDVAKAEGVRSLWRGNLTSVLHKFPSGGINYFVYESTKIFLRPFWRNENDPGIRIRFGCGFLGGTAASALTYPLDIIRTRLAANTAVGRPSLSLRSTVDNLIAEGGFRALFRGVGVTLVCQGTNIALNFAMYETLQIRAIAFERRLWESLGWVSSPNKQRGSFLTSLACGACAGVTASTLIFPLDLVRRRQQVMKGSESGLAVIRDVLQKEGFRGLYQGLGPELLKVLPGVAINFYVYELVRQEILGANIAPR